MKNLTIRRVFCLLLSVLMLAGMLPTAALAAQEGAFVLVAEAGGKLVIAPEYVSNTDGQTVREALAASGHEFTGLEDWLISAIDGVVGNYTRSDQDGGYDLERPAAEVTHYRFSEDTDSRPSEGLQQLMTAMADYARKDADVRAAAREAYDMACEQFVGISSESAAALAAALEKAVSDYEASQSGARYTVTFTDGTGVHAGAVITAENAWGKVWTEEIDGILELPAGSYTFRISRDGLHVQGSIEVSGDMTVQAVLPEQLWLMTDAFRLSGSYGASDNEDSTFADDEFAVGQWHDRHVTVPVSDTFTGTVYSYAEYDTALLDTVPTLTAIYTATQSGEAVEQNIPFASLTSGAVGVLKRGAAGNTVVYRVSHSASDGYTYSQDYTVTFDRIPTLTAISVTDQNGVDQTATTAFDGNVTEYTYKVLDSVTAVTVDAEPLEDSYQVTVNGQDAVEGVTVEVAGETAIDVTVAANGYSNTYTLTIRPGEGKTLSFVTSGADVTLEVVNSNGQVMPYEKFREGISSNRYQYILVPGETYSYVATSGTYYHIADTFTMEDAADSTISVDVPTEDWLTDLAFGTKSSAKYRDTLALDTAFDPADHSYRVSYVDTEHLAYIWAAGSVTDIEAIYDQVFASSLYHSKSNTVSLTSGATSGIQLKRFLMDENPIGNTVTIRLTQESSGVTYYQDYLVEFTRTLTLEDLSAACDGVVTTLMQPDGTAGFDPHVRAYSVTVSMAAAELLLELSAHTGNTCYGETDVGYRVKVDGIEADGIAAVALDGTIETQTVVITVENDKAPDGTAEYVLQILKSPPVEAVFDIAPEGALLTLHETISGQRLWPDENGKFQLCEGYSYHYALTRVGYAGRSGTLCVTRDDAARLVVTDGAESHPVTETEAGGGTVSIAWALAEAPENPAIDPAIPSEWSSFRGNDANNAVTDAPIPTTAEGGTLYWANQIGSGIDSDAVGSPIIVDGDLITYAADKLYRVDTVTGEILQTGQMDHKSSFSITPPVYADGMVFVALSNGTVQAFNAVTLESLWLYTDPLGGQPNCPLTVHGGYLYTGFWNSETSEANFVCLSVTDEDPAQDKESKCASWYVTRPGGFYWAGAYVCDDYLLVGTDDGSNAVTHNAALLLLDPADGALLDSWEGLNGDVRSTIVYDAQTGTFCFTAKGGSFCGVRVTRTDTGWALTDRWSVALENGVGGTPMSTSSPVAYNGRAYVGVSGAGQFSSYSGHNITVIDLTQREAVYRAQTQGYPQTSGLLTTAYEEASGYVYIYFFDNMTPGKLRVLRDRAGQTAADYLTAEGEYQAAYALFTPTGDQAQYAICSPIADEYGTIYFKNDSAHLMAFGSAIEKIEVTTLPERMVYRAGETFDPAGMTVTATYANGKTRDVTEYVTITAGALTAEDPVVTISFEHVMYHNQENGTAMTSGVASTTPVTTLTVTIAADVQMGDSNLDGTIDAEDAALVVEYFYGNAALTTQQLEISDVNGDGTVDIRDANLIVSYFCGSIDRFPAETTGGNEE